MVRKPWLSAKQAKSHARMFVANAQSYRIALARKFLVGHRVEAGSMQATKTVRTVIGVIAVVAQDSCFRAMGLRGGLRGNPRWQPVGTK